MEPGMMLGLLLLGLMMGAAASAFLLKGSRGPNLAASEAELADLKARIDERDNAVKEVRRQADAERAAAAQLQVQITELTAARATAEERASRVEGLEKELRAKDETILQLETRHSSLLTRLDEAEKSQAEKLKTLEEAQRRLAETFKGVAAEALAENNKSFLTLTRDDQATRQKGLEETLKPLADKLAVLEKERLEGFAGLKEQFESLQRAQAQTATETSKLVFALRAPAVRGRWGEIQLKRVVELAGMLEHCDFYEQVSIDTEGGRLRPDLIVKLPNGREIIIDAKVSLSAYLDSLDMADDDARQSKLAEHATQVRQHIQRLSGKAYWDQFEHAPDFVVAFLPGEIFFSAALQKDPELIEFGVDNRVLLATPTTLIALLKAVAYGWRQEKLARNAQEISDLGKELYERLRTFAGHMDGVRAGLERSVESYNRAAGSLETRVLVSARRFKDLAAGTGDEIAPAEVVERVPRMLQSPELAALASTGLAED